MEDTYISRKIQHTCKNSKEKKINIKTKKKCRGGAQIREYFPSWNQIKNLDKTAIGPGGTIGILFLLTRYLWYENNDFQEEIENIEDNKEDLIEKSEKELDLERRIHKENKEQSDEIIRINKEKANEDMKINQQKINEKELKIDQLQNEIILEKNHNVLHQYKKTIYELFTHYISNNTSTFKEIFKLDNDIFNTPFFTPNNELETEKKSKQLVNQYLKLNIKNKNCNKEFNKNLQLIKILDLKDGKFDNYLIKEKKKYELFNKIIDLTQEYIASIIDDDKRKIKELRRKKKVSFDEFRETLKLNKISIEDNTLF